VRRIVFALVAVAPAAALCAQDAPPQVTAERVVQDAREAYGPPDTRTRETCPPQKPGEEIVVCAEQQEQSQFRVPSSGDLDPTGAGARGGVPRAPDVGHVYPGMVVARGCFIPPCPPPMPKIIDLKAIPEAPPGSDADRVAQGLAPTGKNDAPPASAPVSVAEAMRVEEEPATPPE